MTARLLTQAEIVRHVKAVIRAHQAAGLIVTGTKVTFCQGVPTVEVTTAAESAPPPPIVGGVNVQEFTQKLRERANAARRP